MSIERRRRAGLFAAVVAAATLAAAEPPAIQQIPRPDLESAEDAVREQVVAALVELDRLVESDSGPAPLAAAYGHVGRLGLLYELDEMAAAGFANARSLEPGRGDWLYYLGVVRENQGDGEAAARMFRKFLTLIPADGAALIRLGRLELQAQRLEEAEAAFGAALEASPGLAAAQDGLAQVAQARGDLQTAVDLYRQALSQQPEAGAVRYRLGMAYRDLGNLERARQMLADSGSTPASFPDPRMAALQRLAAGSGVHMVRGNTAYVTGDYRAAATHYQRAVRADPENLRARRGLASAFNQLERFAEALSIYEQILDERADDPIVHYNIGTIRVQQGDLEAAVPHFQAAVRASPNYLDAHLNLALALEDLGRLEVAIEHMTRATAIDPQDRELGVQRARLLYRAGRVTAAAAEARRVLALDPKNPGAHLLLGINAAERGHTEGAIEHLRDATAGEDSVALQAARRLGILLGQQRRYAESADALRQAVSLAPEDPELLFARVTALLLAAEHREGLAVLESAVKAFPENNAFKHTLARLLATAPEESLRNGGRALSLANAVFQAQPSIDHAETVAMALAELDRFDEAANWQQRIIDRARGQGRTVRIPALEARLRIYQQQQPVRSPWLQ